MQTLKKEDRETRTLMQRTPPSVPLQNPYVYVTPSTGTPSTGSLYAISNQVSKLGRFVEETTTNVWNHFKTSGNVVDTTLGKLNKGTKILLAGGYDKVYKEAFEVSPNEKLQDSFACLLSTSANPIAGQLFVTTYKLAFLSDQPFSHYSNVHQVAWSYYKVIVPWDKVLKVAAFKNPKNGAEKYIQVVTTEFYEFWFIGFYNPEKALKVLQQAKLESMLPPK